MSVGDDKEKLKQLVMYRQFLALNKDGLMKGEISQSEPHSPMKTEDHALNIDETSDN